MILPERSSACRTGNGTSQDFGKGRPCLNYYIKQCCAPCQGRVSEEEYNEAFQEAMDFIKGGSSTSVKVLTERMEQAAENLEFELAARLRDRINAIEMMGARQKVVAASGEVSRTCSPWPRGRPTPPLRSSALPQNRLRPGELPNGGLPA